MDAVAAVARWMRETIASQGWLEWARPIADTPDWVLVAIGPAFIVLFLLFPMRQHGAREKRRSRRTKSAPAAVATLVSSAPNPLSRQANTRPVSSITAPNSEARSPLPAVRRMRTLADAADSRPPVADDEDNRSVRVFVSSTFLDMQTERHELVTKVFPALNVKYRARGVEVFEVDLRWGITPAQQERGDTLPTLLAEIDRCRPYFIGLIGDRYGWVPPPGALTDKLKSEYPEIADAEGASITAMEVMYGVLSDPETAERALFFERDPNWDWIGSLSEEARAGASVEPDAAQTNLAELKARIRETRARIEVYARPEDIRQRAFDLLDAQLEARFPEAGTPDAFTHTAQLHRAYRRERRGLHVGAAGYTKVLDQWMANRDSVPVLITGASGGGKSTLIANWLHRWRTAHPESKAFVFEHYLGASPDSADPVLLMRRLWEFLNRATDDAVDLPRDDAEFMEVSAGLAKRLAQASATATHSGARILIALDGLDKLSSEQSLRWLPIVQGVNVLTSSLPCEAETAALARGFKPLDVKPLTENERHAFIDGTLARWRRELEPQNIASVLRPGAVELAGSPLYLKTVLDELRLSADNATLAARLDVYRSAVDLADLFDRVLARLEDDCEAGFVARALRLIGASRAGLEETEIIAITGATPLAWATLRNGLGGGLRDAAGRMAFGHDYLRHAVSTRYLKSAELKRATHLAIADQFEKFGPGARQAEELPFQLRAAGELGAEQAWERLEAILIDLDCFGWLLARGEGELWGHWQALKARGRDPETLLCCAFDDRVDEAQWTRADIHFASVLDDFLQFAGSFGKSRQRLSKHRTDACRRLLLANPDDATAAHELAASLVDFGDFCARRGQLGDAQLTLKAFEESHEVRERMYAANPNDARAARDLAVSLSRRGDFYQRRSQAGDADQALRAFQSSFEFAHRLHIANPDDAQAARDLSGSLNRLGDFYHRRGQVGDAERALRAFDACHDVLQRLHAANPYDARAARDLGVSLDRLADFYLRRGEAGDADQALRAFQAHFEFAKRLHEANPNDGQAARDLSVSLERLGDFYQRRGQVGDADHALQSFQASFELRHRLHIANPDDAQAARDLGLSLGRLGNFYRRRGQVGDADHALQALQASFEIALRLQAANPNDAPAACGLAMSLNGLANFYQGRGQVDDADLALQAFQASAEIVQRLQTANPNDARLARDWEVALGHLGDFYQRRGQAGDADRALQAFQSSFEVAQRVHAANPNDARATRDLSGSLNQLGDFYQHRGQAGDAGRALQAFEACHDMLGRLHAVNPNDAEAARDLGVSLERLGVFYLRRGDADKALQAFQANFEISQRLHAANPNDGQAARDLCASLVQLGDFYKRRNESGDAEQALRAFEGGFEIAHRRSSANPYDAQAARSLAVLLERLGDFYLPRDTEKALPAFEASFKIRQRLHEANPNDGQAARDLSVSLERLGDFYQRRGQVGDADHALQSFQASFELRHRLHIANPDDAQAARNVSVSLVRLGDFYRRRGETDDAERALQAFETSLGIRRRLHAANPDDAQATHDLINSCVRMEESKNDRSYARLALDLATKLQSQGRLAAKDELMIQDLRKRAEG